MIVASFHGTELAAELVRGRDRLLNVLIGRGMETPDAADLIAALDGLVLDALLRRKTPETVNPERIIEKFDSLMD